ncbi:MAG: hypothetical protein AMXMBFR33_01740 [Candidatus Xenobia bacterium]
MSEALALVPANDSALARAMTGSGFLPSDVPAYLLAAEDEQGDLQGIAPAIPLVKFNGKYGTYYLNAVEEKDAGPKEMTGVALARLQTAALFRATDPAKVEGYKRIGFNTLLLGEHKTVCRAPDTRQPAQLNPALSDEQRAEAKKLGIHGALGKTCLGCPMARYSTELDGSPCKRGTAMLWLDAKRGEPVVFQLIAFKSVKALEDFVAHITRNGKVSLYGYVWQLGREVVTDKGNEYFRLTVKAGQAASQEEFEVYRKLRAELMPMLVRTSEETIEHDEDAPDVQRYDAAADSSGGRVINADGGDVSGMGFGGEVPF